jgi:hypothetical protein
MHVDAKLLVPVLYVPAEHLAQDTGGISEVKVAEKNDGNSDGSEYQYIII